MLSNVKMSDQPSPPTFKDLGIDGSICEKLLQKGIVSPTPIQNDVYVSISEGQSLIGFSKTGTGKTLAYMVPLLTRNSQVLAIENQFSPRVLVLVPTRELALQVYKDLEYLGGAAQRGVVVVGGESEDEQIKQGRGVFWLIATPGRLLDLAERRLVTLNAVTTVVFDEADRLLDMGFVDDMRQILKYIPKGNAQLLFFSATVNFGIDEMAYEFGIEELKRIGHQTDELTVAGLDHRLAYVGDDEKFHVLAGLLDQYRGQRGIVFSNYRERAAQIASRLRGLGSACEVLTSQVSQSQRIQIMEKFRNGTISVLIASDLAARGLDVSDLDFVVNFDLPEDSATYVHRVGRTARAGKKGIAISFVGFEDSFRLERLQKFLGLSIEKIQLDPKIFSGRLPHLGSTPRPQQRPQSREVPRPGAQAQARGQNFSANSHRNHRDQQTRNQQIARPKAPRVENPKFPASWNLPKKNFAQKLFDRILNFLGLGQKNANTSARPGIDGPQKIEGQKNSESAGNSGIRASGIRGGGGGVSRPDRGGQGGSSRGGRGSRGRPFRSRGPKPRS